MKMHSGKKHFSGRSRRADAPGACAQPEPDHAWTGILMSMPYSTFNRCSS